MRYTEYVHVVSEALAMAAAKPRKSKPLSYKNRTLRIPSDLLQRVMVKLAREDRKLNPLALELFEQWAGWPEGDPVERLLVNAARRTRGRRPSAKKAVPFTTDELHEDDA
jgi:hypothetical protein